MECLLKRGERNGGYGGLTKSINEGIWVFKLIIIIIILLWLLEEGRRTRKKNYFVGFS